MVPHAYIHILSRLKRKVLVPQRLTLLWGKRTDMTAEAADGISDVAPLVLRLVMVLALVLVLLLALAMELLPVWRPALVMELLAAQQKLSGQPDQPVSLHWLIESLTDSRSGPFTFLFFQSLTRWAG